MPISASPVFQDLAFLVAIVALLIAWRAIVHGD